MNRDCKNQAFINLFNVVRNFVLMACGDGDGWVICKNYNFKEVANMFEKNKQIESKWFLIRINNDDFITFYKNQESITFLDSLNKDKIPSWAGNIIVEI